MRVGIGYDVHKFAEGRKLILGGVEIPYGKGLLGHSDADVIVHAIMDALLGAAALGDIGQHFRIRIRPMREYPVLLSLRRLGSCWKRTIMRSGISIRSSLPRDRR